MLPRDAVSGSSDVADLSGLRQRRKVEETRTVQSQTASVRQLQSLTLPDGEITKRQTVRRHSRMRFHSVGVGSIAIRC